MIRRAVSAALWLAVAWQLFRNGAGEMMQPVEHTSENGLLQVTLTVSLIDSLPGLALAENGLRRAPAYNGRPIGPTLRVQPGDTVEITLINDLPAVSDLDRELYQYLQQDAADVDDVNATVIANRLSPQGTMHQPEYGFWGLNYMNLHFHGLEVSPFVEDTFMALDGGGETKTYKFQIPADQDPGLYWYHDQVHGKVAYSFMSSLFGFLIVEGTDRDLTAVSGIKSARECLLLLSETYVNAADGTVAPYFPTVGVFDWVSVTNGNLATASSANQLQLRQGEKVLFRVASATVEPTIRLFVRNHKMLIVARDGRPLPLPLEADYVEVSGGGRVEFLIKFSQPGDFVMERAAFRYLPPTKEACWQELGWNGYPCSSFDTLKDVAMVSVQANAFASNTRAVDYNLGMNMQLPPHESPRLQALAQQPSVATKTIHLNRQTSYPLFQIPHSSASEASDTSEEAPPALGYGINGRLFNPTRSSGTVTAGTCETWEIISDMPSMQIPFHVDAALFRVLQVDGEPVEIPYWRDVMPVANSLTIHICFDRLHGGGGGKLLVHSHAPNQWDSGMALYYDVIAPPPPPQDDEDDESLANGDKGGSSTKKSSAAALFGSMLLLLLSSSSLLVWLV